MKKTLFFLLLMYAFSYGQQVEIDSLKLLIRKENNESVKLQLLYNLNLITVYNGDSLNEELYYFKKALGLSKELNNHEFEIKSAKNLARYFLTKENFQKAKKYAHLSNELSNKYFNSKERMLSNNLLGNIYNHFDEYTESIVYLKKAQHIYNTELNEGDRRGNRKNLSIIYANLEVTYRNLKKDSLAYVYHTKLSRIADAMKDYERKSHANATIAWSHFSLDQYELAEKYFNLGLKDSLNIKLKIYLIAIHHGLGETYSKWGKYDKALKHDKIALAFFKQTKNKIYIAKVLNNMSVVFMKTNDIPNAIEYANSSLKVAEEVKSYREIFWTKITQSKISVKKKDYSEAEKTLKEIINSSKYNDAITRTQKAAIFSMLTNIYKEKRQFKKALHYNALFIRIHDSMTQRKLANITKFSTKLESEKKARENLQLKADNATQELKIEKENKLKWYFAFGLLTSLLTLVVFWFYYKRNQKQKAIIENLQKDLHHRIKNNLSIIDSLIEDIKEEFDDTRFSNKLGDLQNRIDSINEVHQQLYQNMDITSLNLKKYVDKLAKNIQQTFGKSTIQIENNIDKNTKLQVGKSFPVGLIINEFLTNSFKHAFKENVKGKIKIDLKEKGVNYLLSLSDNGKGLPKDLDISKLNSFGMEVMKLLSQQIGGTFSLKSEHGVQLKIEFPKV